MKKSVCFYLLLFSFGMLSSCNKEDAFLDAKPNISLVVPSNLDDYQKLLYNEGVFNTAVDPAMGSITAEEYYVTPAFWAGRPILDRNLYVFGSGYVYESWPLFTDWELSYKQVYYSNIVLDGIDKLEITNDYQTQYKTVKGQALFFRARAFYNLVQTFALPFDSTNFSTMLGIPLRLTSDFNVVVQRSTIQQTYDRILGDLLVAVELLPVSTTYPTQPSKTAANALLARIYLAMRNYAKALQYSDITLSFKSDLIDYNTLSPTNTNLSATYLKEDIFQASLLSGIFTFSGSTTVDTNLLKLYDDPNDLRRTVCYRTNGSNVEFRGTYGLGTSSKYSGLATDEMYLIRAECLARQGNVSGAMADVNTLLRTRWKKNGTSSTYVDKTASSTAVALSLILKERRKELPFRGLRWTDIRRLNLDPGFQTTLTRVMNGVTYILPPGDPRFAMPIPLTEIQLSGIQQNDR